MNTATNIPIAMNGFIKGLYVMAGDKPSELRLLDQVAILRSTNWIV
jgi:hypothetical protein